MPIEIHDVDESHLDALAAVFADAYRPEKTGEVWAVPPARKVLDYWYRRAPAKLRLVALEEGVVLGGLFLDVMPWWDGPRLVDGEFFVRTDAQARGIGRLLLRTALERGRDLFGAVHFETKTFLPEDEHPLKWYSALGLKRMELLTVICGRVDEALEKLGQADAG